MDFKQFRFKKACKSRFGHAKLAIAMLSLLLIQLVTGSCYAVTSGRDLPYFRNQSTKVALQDSSSVSFTFMWFNREGGNYGYDGSSDRGSHVWLKVDGELALDLTSAANSSLSKYKCRMFNGWSSDWGGGEDEANDLCSGQAGVVLDKYFSGSNFKYGQIIFSNPFRAGTNNDFYYVNVQVTFQEWNVDSQHTIEIVGKWRQNGTNKGNKTVDNTLSLTTDKPITPMPSTFAGSSDFGASIKRTASRKATYTYKYPATKYKTFMNSSQFVWNRFSVGIFSTKPTDATVSNAYWGSNNAKCLVWNDSEANATTMSGEFAVDNNYRTDTIYPRLRMFMDVYLGYTVNYNSWVQQPMAYNKNYGAVIIPGFPRPTNIQTQTNQWKKSIKITWSPEIYDTKNVNKNGQWCVFRATKENATTQTLVATLDYNTREFTDQPTGSSAFEYDTDYFYWVAFKPNDWNIADDAQTNNKYSVYTDLYAGTSVQINRSLNLTGSAVGKDAQIDVTWSLPSGFEDAGTNTYKVNLYHSLTEGSFSGNPIYTWSVTDPGTTSGTWSHTENLGSWKTAHYYQFVVEAMGKTWKSNSFYDRISGTSKVTKLSASRGDYTGAVKLTWTAKHIGSYPCYYTLSRRALGSTKESDWRQIYTTSGTAASYSYDDNNTQPGSYYQYKVESSIVDENVTYRTATETTDGFSLATGVVSGRVTYGTGTAVKDVKISLTSEDTNARDQFRSLYFSGNKSGMISALDTAIVDNGFTVQFWIRPELKSAYTLSKDHMLYDLYYQDQMRFYTNDKNDDATLSFYNGSSTSTIVKAIPYGQYSHVSMIYNSDSILTVIIHTPTGKTTHSFVHHHNRRARSSFITLGNQSDYNKIAYKGYLDEFRLWDHALTEEEIEKNYDRVLSGSETGLSIYWPMDEGIESPEYVYDFSRTDGANNGHHAEAKGAASSKIVPSAEQLSLYALTDQYGNYVVRGIPFCGEGTNYVIRPSLGVHKFDAQQNTRYISANSLIYSDVNFTDVSSFNVSGRILYTNTTYPVEGVAIYVDGTVCARNGEMVQTDANGNFTVSVPIGDHYMSVGMTGHTFTNAAGKSFKNTGYYPNQIDTTCMNMQTHTFDQDITGLTFYDNTLVPVYGRVVGGATEDGKPLGFGSSVNNIGQATITMTAGNINLNADKDNDYNARTEVRNLTTPSGASSTGEAYVGSGEEGSKIITIKTDAATGEFAVMLPPLQYTVNQVSVDKNTSIKWTTASKLDCSNPLLVYTDSIKVDTITKYTKYVASLKKCYRSPATLKVTQPNALKAGAFGADSITVVDGNSVKHRFALYDKTAAFNLPTATQSAYKFGYPIFQQGLKYKFKLEMYEEYVNKDGAKDVKYTVPLEGLQITINNRLSDGTAINVDPNNLDDPTKHGTVNEELSASNVVTLDSLGRAVYTWTAGMPNIQGEHTFTMDMTYEKEGTNVGWVGNGFKGIILGSLTNGSNFVTAGPDKVDMILRDPAGSNSYSWIEEGTTFTTTTQSGYTIVGDNTTNITVKAGMKNTVITGTAAGGLVASSVTQESAFDASAGFNRGFEEVNDSTTVVSSTTTKRIQTSSSPDFVGAVGDVFIGYSTNYIFGKAREVAINWDLQTGAPQLATAEIFSMGDVFGTAFSYTQNFIENTLIPNFIEMRNSIIESVDSYDNITPDENKVRYVSTLDRNDPRFGTSNNDKDVWGNEAVVDGTDGPSYHMILPNIAFTTVAGKKRIKENYHTQDTILWHNQQVSTWEQQLYNNEKAKVTAIENRSKYIKDNYSFDAGASVESSAATVSTKEYVSSTTNTYMVLTSFEKDFDIANCGLTVSNECNFGGTEYTSETTSTENSIEVGFAFEEDGDDDALTVDVLTCPDGYGPIFYTRGGQTSAPYEDEVVTKYYRPGFVISAKTMQIEVPQLTADVTTLSGVPSGKAANFTVQILNNSETGEDCWFNLGIVDTSNPNGADVLMDGYNITNGRTILVPAGTPLVKTIQVKQTNTNIYDYENLILRINSLSQPDDTGIFPAIADELALTVHFQKASSDVDLELDLNAINTMTGTSLKFMVSGYDINAVGLQKLELQYQLAGDPQWATVKEYTVAQLDNSGNFEYVLDMSNTISYPDGEYNFRALCTSVFGSETVTTASEVSTLYKDVARPRLMSTISPTDGILNAGDDILLTFNEDIRDGEIRELDNFIIKGELNESSVAHDVAANFTGAPAKTASRIDLNKKSFAVDMWLQYASAGHLFVHGSGSEMFDVSVDANNKLVVSISGQTYTSTQALQPNTWMFLSVAFDSEANTLSAHYAYDSYDVTLFNNLSVNAYSGYGSLQLGEGLTGQMHEVALWDNARTWIDAQGEMYKSKSRYTQGLIGYWRMNEGHGTTATDIARSRTMTMPSATSWYYSKVNYSLILEENLILGAFIGDKTTANDESYLAELWFRADPSNNAVASIMALSDDRLDIHLTETGAMEMVANGATYTVSNTDYRDGNWHHLAFNVLKSTNGNATVYVDGKACKSVSASSVPALQSSHMLFGGRKTTVGGGSAFVQPLKGNLDEIRLWKGYFDASVIRNNMYNRVDNDNEALLAYYPFEYSHRDEGNQLVESATLTNRIDGATGLGAEIQIMSGGHTYNNGTTTVAQANMTSAGVVGLKAAPVRDNLSFNFTASERQLLIQLTDYPSRLENCTVTLTVKGIRDEHGNTCENITWDLLVRQNQLLWTSSSANVRKEGAEAVTFTAEMINEGSSSEGWSIIGLPEWLKASAESGTIAPQATRTITFTVDPSLSAGRYDETLFLTGSMNIAEPFAINVVSLVEAPDWSVDATEYELNMNMVGRLKVEGNYSEDAEDIVAAFNGERCVGVAKPTYIERFDSYYLMMTIYGNSADTNSADTNSPLQFKVFDASTGIVYPSSHLSTAINFVADAFKGSLANPVIVETTNEIEQTVALNKGWTWSSLFLNPTNSSPADIFGGESGESVVYIKSKNKFTQKSGTTWAGQLNALTSGAMYKIKTTAATSVSIIGAAVNAAASSAAQTVVNGWNWLGYTNSGSCSLNAAFADLNPQDDDIVKNQSSFAVYSSGEWIGSLSAVVPGSGYAYYSNAASAKSFNYPVVNAVSGSSNAPVFRGEEAMAQAEAQALAADFQNNMNIIVVVKDGEEIVSDAVIMAYDDEEHLRGISRSAVRNNLHFLTVGGQESGEQIHFVVVYNDEELNICNTITYSNDKMMGTVGEPYVIQLGNANGIESLDADDEDDNCYNVIGQKVDRHETRGLHIIKNRKVLE